MKRVLRVAAVSSKSLLGRVEENLANHERWIRRAADQGAAFIGFPEGSLTGYVREPAAAVPLRSRAVERLAELARQFGVFVAFGLNERRGRRIHNTCAIVGPDGLVGVMRKINCMPAESEFYTSGQEFPILEVAGWRMGITICADASVVEMFRILALRGAECLFAPHANTLANHGGQPPGWKRWRRPTWRRFLADAPLYVVACNNAGLFEHPSPGEEGSRFCGGALILSPQGEVLAQSTVRRKVECLILADLDPSRLMPVPHGDVLRPEILYGRRAGWVVGYGKPPKG